MLTNPPDSAPDIAVAMRSFSRRSCMVRSYSLFVCLFVFCRESRSSSHRLAEQLNFVPSQNACSPCAMEDVPSTLLFTDALRQHFLNGLSLRDAIIPPAAHFATQAFSVVAPSTSQHRATTRSTPSLNRHDRDGVLEALQLETTSTWLLVEALFDVTFSPFGRRDATATETSGPSSSLTPWLPPSPEAEHLIRAMSWLQLELRKDLYIEEEGRPPRPVGSHDSVIDVTGSFVQGDNFGIPDHEPMFERCLKYAAAGKGWHLAPNE